MTRNCRIITANTVTVAATTTGPSPAISIGVQIAVDTSTGTYGSHTAVREGTCATGCGWPLGRRVDDDSGKADSQEAPRPPNGDDLLLMEAAHRGQVDEGGVRDRDEHQTDG